MWVMEDIIGIPFQSLTPSVLLGIAVLLLLLGKIVPRSTYLDKAEEAERWRKAYETERESNELRDEMAKEHLDVSRTTLAFIKAVFQTSAGNGSPREGASNDPPAQA